MHHSLLLLLHLRLSRRWVLLLGVRCGRHHGTCSVKTKAESRQSMLGTEVEKEAMGKLGRIHEDALLLE